MAALATPPGEGGVAIIRLSGKGALEIGAKVFSGPLHTYASHTAHYGKILDKEGKLVDKVLILPLLGTRSYTGEDTVEIHCHGGSLVSRKVLETVFAAGARPARPGEFTFRAFMNGKIDLAQAEAVQELICAKNDLALDAAKNQLEGHLSHKIGSFQETLIDVAATLEAWIDFPEEDLDFESLEQLFSTLKKTQAEIQKLSDTFHEGKIVRNGVSLCLAGLPNAGKSSLMNALLKKERAIVTDIPGTTRDLLEEELRLGKLHIRLTDTAGIRDTQEVIEKEGIRRSRLAIAQADLILLILDITDQEIDKAQDLLDSVPSEKTILV
ncbi:MAG: tRNA uridine-5-carboxymethylaminomethyl(34) synthesis GTPase MnmE, partial [Chlamydiales bacterium]|nr:tRNA uridine-5-carboxymethylaminomethyl(34) synthesis GTPase MnmE [Chlamydiales bacterium]